jgi:uncharacterized membrane protein YtjA (UPF0391 family)
LAAVLTGFIPPLLQRALAASRPDFVPSRARNFPGFAGRSPREPLFRPPIVSAAAARRSQSRGYRNRRWKTEVLTMLSWVVTFLIVALIAGILGFGGVAGASIEIAKVIFFIAVMLFLVSAVVGLARGRTRV